MATLCCLSAGRPLFCLAIVSMKSPAAPLSAVMRLVLSWPPIGSSIDPEASSTSTMSRGLTSVVVVSEVDDMTESVVRKSDFSSSATRTVLSVQIRPTLCVEMCDSLPPPAAQWRQRSRVSGSTFAVACTPPPSLAGEAFESGMAPIASVGRASSKTSAIVANPLIFLLIASPLSFARRP